MRDYSCIVIMICCSILIGALAGWGLKPGHKEIVASEIFKAALEEAKERRICYKACDGNVDKD